MVIKKLIKVILLLLGVTFILLQSFALESEGSIVGSVMLLLLTYLYYRYTDKKNGYFLFFLIAFSAAQLLGCVAYFIPDLIQGNIDYIYYTANVFYIVSYIILLLKILIKLDIRRVFIKFLVPIVILVVLDVFSVSILSSTTEEILSSSQYALEFTYNTVVMALLSVALINYMYRNDNKSMLFLIGSICIVFSETIQLAYYYILDSNDLGFIYSFFLVIALIFFYLQSQLETTGPQPIYTDEQLKA